MRCACGIEAERLKAHLGEGEAFVEFGYLGQLFHGVIVTTGINNGNVVGVLNTIKPACDVLSFILCDCINCDSHGVILCASVLIKANILLAFGFCLGALGQLSVE